MSALPIARLFGFEIRVHVTWAVILAVIAVTVVGQVEAAAPTSSPELRWVLGAIVAGLFLLSALAHELGHAIAARRAGAPGGVVVVYFFGGAATPILETRTPRDEIVAAAAGPAVSIVIGSAMLGIAVIGTTIGGEAWAIVGQVALVVGILNLVLGGVNLLPAFPLDGGRIARGVAWARTGDPAKGLRFAARSGRGLGIAAAAAGIVLILTQDSIDGLMLALSGWFLVSSSRAVERMAAVDALLEGLVVRDVLDRDAKGVPAGLTLDTFAAQVLDVPGGSVAIVDGPRLLGVLGERQVRRVRRSRWQDTRAGDLMTAADDLPAIDPETTLRAALDHLHRTGLDGLPVLESGVLAGLVTRRAVAEAIRGRVAAKGGTA
ncbi:MAG: site-2 protease family protein [Chloroflexota bacterium]